MAGLAGNVGSDKNNGPPGTGGGASFAARIMKQHPNLVICLLLSAVVLLIYGQVFTHDFINFDDQAYVYQNELVKAGLSLKGVVWAVTANQEGSWHPLTWLSHMLDCELFGLHAGWHHLVNVLLHLLNTWLIFFLLRRITGAFWKSCIIAALFALHPLHVESVAWIAERKDVLSTLFWLLTLWSYILYVKETGKRWYILSLLFFALGLLSKPMLVTLPFVLLLLDFWPLRRFSRAPLDTSKGARPEPAFSRLLLEKIPFLVLAVLACIITVQFEKSGGAMRSLDTFPLDMRLSNALVAYVRYIGMMFWPSGLALFYPYPESVTWWEVTGAFFVLISVTTFSLRYLKERPYLAVGWFFFLGTLIPVIGLIQVGLQSLADRYTYIPLLGLFVMLAWGVEDLLKRWPARKRAFAILVPSLLLALSLLTYVQVGYWENNFTLYSHALEVTKGNYMLANNLGTAYQDQGRHKEALRCFRKALDLKNTRLGHFNLGTALQKKGRHQEAIKYFRNSLKMKFAAVKGHYNMGTSLLALGRRKRAIYHFRQALLHDPKYALAHNNLGTVMENLGRLEEAIVHYRKAIVFKPSLTKAYNNMGSALFRLGRLEEALEYYRKYRKLRPSDPLAIYNFGLVYQKMGRLDSAIDAYTKALRLNPRFKPALNNLGRIEERRGRLEAAQANFKKVIQLSPSDNIARYNLANVLFRMGRFKDAAGLYQAVLRSNPRFVEALINLGTLMEKFDRPEKAVALFRKALKIQPGNVLAQGSLDRILPRTGEHLSRTGDDK